jgi:phage terminase large subunit-like protein
MVASIKRVDLRPQPGPQRAFLASSADITIYGGAAGGGKSWALLMDMLRGHDDPYFRGVMFRRIMPNLTNQGGLWQEALDMYPQFGANMKSSPRLVANFPSGAAIQFTHLQHEHTKLDHKGAQYTAIAFDELTEFTESQFWYLITRLRSPKSRFQPWVRATTNPDADSWVARLIEWWIDPDTGYPIPERSGELRYMVRDGDAIRWVDAEYRDEDGDGPMSITFIPAKLDDNQALLAEDPEYRKNLKMQGLLERARLLGGNWKIRQIKGLFEYHTIDPQGILPSLVPEGLRRVRYWDLADTEPHEKNKNPDETSSCLASLHVDAEGETFYIFDSTAVQIEGAAKRAHMRHLAQGDGFGVEIHLEQEGGSSGKEVMRDYKTTHLAGYNVHSDRPTGSKSVRAGRWKPLAESGRVVLVRNEDGTRPEWFDAFISQLESFDGTTDEGKKRDRVDSASGAYAVLKRRPTHEFAYVL